MPSAFALALIPAVYAGSVAREQPRAPAPRFAALDRRPKLAPPTRDQAPPPVEALELAPVAPETAVEINAAIPFSTGPNPAARPFRIGGDAASVARSTACLAAAVLYEAGDDTTGQRAVAQVIINRMRHPAFPKTICGVVFQGQERRTGCQFTFTCDGALNRSWSEAAWGRARDVARLALTGSVYAKVGHSTHYHTNWVVPYWSSSLDKVAAVDTHLFFRWTGWWGTPGAFRGGHAGSEPNIARLARFSPAHVATPDEAALAGMTLEQQEAARALALIDALKPAKARDEITDGGTFLVRVRKGVAGDRVAALALETCGDRDYCKFMAWNDKDDMPSAFPVPPAALDTMAFSYLRNRKTGFDKPLWNCDRYDRENPRDCMRSRNREAAARLRLKLRDRADKRAGKDDEKQEEKQEEKGETRSARAETGAKPAE